MRTLPHGVETDFKNKIQIGTKIHSFRLGSRWQPGTKIHFYDTSPRAGGERFNINPVGYPRVIRYYVYDNTLESYENFTLYGNAVMSGEEAHSVAVPIVMAVEEFCIAFHVNQWYEDSLDFLSIGGRLIYDLDELYDVCNSDGLSIKDFRQYFYDVWRQEGQKPLKGQIIHWTDKLYTPGEAKKLTLAENG